MNFTKPPLKSVRLQQYCNFLYLIYIDFLGFNVELRWIYAVVSEI